MTRNMQNRDPQLETSGKIIGFYEREFYVLSNFSSFAVDWQGRRWQTSEHAYQAAHFIDTDQKLFEKIHKARSAHEAFKIAKRNANKAPGNWDQIKTQVMEEIVYLKLLQNPYVKKKLLQTEDLLLVEDSPKDSFWGWGPDREGRNELGKIWMKLRQELRNK